MQPASEARTTSFPELKEQALRIRRTGLVADWSGAPGLGALLVAGPDAGGFLQTQLTSDVGSLEPGTAQATARLSRSGGLIAHGVLAQLPDRGQPFASYLLIVAADEADALKQDLEASQITEDVLIEDGATPFDGLLVQGAEVADLEEAASATGIAIAWSWTGDPGWLVLGPRGAGSLAKLRETVRGNDFLDLDETPGAAELWRWLTLEAGLPVAGADFQPGRTLLPATGLEQRTVSATKGCYRGQEVVARVRTYGSVPRALRGLLLREPLDLQPGQLPAPGDPLLTVEDEKIGAWASAGYSATLDCVVALAYLDRDHRAPDQVLPLQAGDLDLEAEIVLLPLHSAPAESDRAVALHDRALREFHAGRDRDAAALLEEAIRLDPSLSDAYEALGVILGRAERYHEAIDVFQRLGEVAPEEPMVHTNLSLFYMKIGDKEEAERQKSLATLKRFGGDESPEERAIREAGEVQERRRDAERRRAMFAEVLQADPVDGLALMGLGSALLDLERYEEAAGHLGRALESQPDNSALYLSRGKALEKLERHDEARETYRAGVEVASRRGDFLPLKELEHRLFLLEAPAG